MKAVSVEFWAVVWQISLQVACDQILLLFLCRTDTDESAHIQMLLLVLPSQSVHVLSGNQSEILMHIPQADYLEVRQLQVLIGMHLLKALQSCSHHSRLVLVFRFRPSQFH